MKKRGGKVQPRKKENTPKEKRWTVRGKEMRQKGWDWGLFPEKQDSPPEGFKGKKIEGNSVKSDPYTSMKDEKKGSEFW